MKLKIPRMGEEEFGWHEFFDFEPRLKTNFGASVNVLPNFLAKMGRKKSSLWTNGIPSLLVNAQLHMCHGFEIHIFFLFKSYCTEFVLLAMDSSHTHVMHGKHATSI
ncbi:hypothetical protein AVEN_209177-1 [Araneus ventricosus]|uniref:Uncharacterized protein n=1 Tax=Araneus ventricosus TaxID=182803 RepID=A0A4Y2TPD6_ARAVE|nr:hypothetical protein AVEN_209177-1 [Araneus ventricosus]